jgi:hypothetical protein
MLDKAKPGLGDDGGVLSTRTTTSCLLTAVLGVVKVKLVLSVFETAAADVGVGRVNPLPTGSHVAIVIPDPCGLSTAWACVGRYCAFVVNLSLVTFASSTVPKRDVAGWADPRP